MAIFNGSYNWNFQDETDGFIVIENVVAPEKYPVDFSDQGPLLYTQPVLRYLFRMTKGGVQYHTPWLFPNAFPHIGCFPPVDSDVSVIYLVHLYEGVTADIRKIGNL